MKKDTNFAGTFYPDSKDELLKYFNFFDELYAKNFLDLSIKPKIIVVPHAGYIYSGFTASVAYNLASRSTYDSVVIIAPSHRAHFDGISISGYSAFATPLGEIATDTKLAKELQTACGSGFISAVHSEHSSEVQLPFIKHYLSNAKLIEIIYANAEPQQLENTINLAAKNSNNLVVVSSDLSHFYDQQGANTLDGFCIEALKTLDCKLLDSHCEACGAKGLAAAIRFAKKRNLRPTILDYRTSADANGDFTRVVGYLSACFH